MSSDYETQIGNFITRLREYPAVEITLGQTAAILQGEYAEIFRILELECKDVLGQRGKCAVVLKMLNVH